MNQRVAHVLFLAAAFIFLAQSAAGWLLGCRYERSVQKGCKTAFGMLPRPSRGEFTEEHMREVLSASPEDEAALKKLLE